MKKRSFLAIIVISIALMTGCAVQGKQEFKPMDLSSKLQSGQYVQKVDKFLFILDASGTMAEPYNEKRKLTIAKEIISNIHRTIPKDMKLEGAIRTFGNTVLPFSSRTDMTYSFAEYSVTKNLDEGLKFVKRASGKSPMGLAIAAGIEDLRGRNGKTAVIIVSDGVEDDKPIAAAEAMKRQYGDSVAIYPILIGDAPGGRQTIEKLARAGISGFSETGDNLLTPEAIADFVEKVFLAKVSDNDGDGVPNDKDKCPDTPKGIKVDKEGCPLDSDGDGVPDDRDLCPDTPAGTKVDDRGCPSDDVVVETPPLTSDVPCLEVPKNIKGVKVDDKGCWLLESMLFDFNKFVIKKKYYKQLNELAKILKKNPDLRVIIHGHTDNIGTAEYNQRLSEKRAQAVLKYLKGKGVEPKRLSTVGYGYSKPTASDTTKNGRAKNRRVDLEPMNIKKD